MKLFPILAGAYIHGAGTDYVSVLYLQLIKEIEKGDFKLLDILNHLSAGMKGLYTQTSVDGIYRIREAVGGAGYSSWSGITAAFDDMSPSTTFEGDNTVMLQQCYNYLIKVAEKVTKGETNGLLPIFKYLEMINRIESVKCKASKVEDFLDINQVLEAIQAQNCYRLKRLLAQRKSSEASRKDFINSEKALDIVTVAKDHVKYVSMTLFQCKITPNSDFDMR